MFLTRDAEWRVWVCVCGDWQSVFCFKNTESRRCWVMFVKVLISFNQLCKSVCFFFYSGCGNGSRSVMMTVKRPTGLQQTQRSVLCIFHYTSYFITMNWHVVKNVFEATWKHWFDQYKCSLEVKSNLGEKAALIKVWSKCGVVTSDLLFCRSVLSVMWP